MAKKKQFISDYSAKRIGDLIEEVLNNAEKLKWQKPWVNVGMMDTPCRNIDRPDPYQGVNEGLLSLVMSVKNYRTPLFLTGDKARDMGLSIKKQADGKREEAWPVFKWLHLIYDKDRNRITYEQYCDLDEEEQQQCRERWSLRGYLVYNIDQTTMKEDLPKTYEKFVALYPDTTDGMKAEEDAQDEALDYILNTPGVWRCPIHHQLGDRACYSYSSDFSIESIRLPMRDQFKTVSAYYGTALHEMAHSTKGDPKMRRDYGGKSFGTEGYALEELVAEFTAAFVGCDRGHTKTIDKEHIAYVQSWRKAIKKKDIVSTIVDDLMRATNYEIRILRETDEMLAKQTTKIAA